jgi:four helix bundle protein
VTSDQWPERQTGKTVPVKSFKQLIAWQKAMDLAVRVYSVTKGMPREEVFGLTAQVRRAAVSVPSNIAEGQARGTTRDFLRFLHMALGSCSEVETQLVLARRLGFVPESATDDVLLELSEVGRVINGLIRSLASKDDATLPPE